VKTILEGFAYNDVLILPGFAEVVPADIDISTQFTRNIRINVPISSSPMDTVTHEKLATRIALHGGIGIIDRNLSIETQCNKVQQVKRYMSTVIRKPFTLSRKNTVTDARNLMQEKSISGIPIIEDDGRLMGIITQHDLQFVTDDNVLIASVMRKDNLITAPVGITPEEANRKFREAHVKNLLLIDENFMLQGLMTLKDTTKKNNFPHATLSADGQLRVGAAIGATGDFYDRAQALRDAGADAIVIDSSHGHSQNVINALIALKKISGIFPDVIVGNVATAEAASLLCRHDADAIKVGIGPGSICTTRIVSGAGVPQLSAIMWAREGIQGEIPIIADGGISYSGDITKAIAAGASSVMIGSLFAGTDESPGEEIIAQGRKYKTYRGMGSAAILNTGSDRYGSKAVPEGIEAMVPYKGSLSLVLTYLVGGLRQGMGYAGCVSIKDLQDKTTFVRITHAGVIEGHPHGVLITNEAPNYHVSER